MHYISMIWEFSVRFTTLAATDYVNTTTAYLDFYSVIFALVLAPSWLPRLYPGVNHFERKKNAKAKFAHRVWTTSYLFAFCAAALSLYLKTQGFMIDLLWPF